MRKRSRRSSRSTRVRSGRHPGREAAAILARPSLAMLLLAAGLLLASAFVAIEIQRNALGRQAAAYRAEIAVAEATHAQLVTDVATKQTNDYVMNRARDYGYVLPSETLIGVQQPAPVPVSAVIAVTPSRLQKWIALFFGSR
ncbi:MAG: hypothetical protein ACYC9W_05180 [Candidatus Limnocylindria bacterium]